MKYPQYLEKLVVDGANLTPASMTAGTLAPILAGWCGYAPLSLVSRRARRKWELLNLMATQPHITARGLSTIQAPTLVLAGEHDIAPERHTRYIAASIPGRCAVSCPGTTAPPGRIRRPSTGRCWTFCWTAPRAARRGRGRRWRHRAKIS